MHAIEATKENPGSSGRFENIEILRGFAALAVVVYHVIEHMKWTDFPTSGPLLLFRIGWIGVDLFFVISGFVITYSAIRLYQASPEGFHRAYWTRRIARILPLYLLTMALWLAFINRGMFQLPFFVWAEQILTHLAFIHSFWPETHGTIDGANWSLAVEMHFYLAVALLVPWLATTRGWRIALYGILIAWAWRATCMLHYGYADVFPLFVKTAQLPGALDEFAGGAILARLALGKSLNRRFAAIGFLLLAAAAAFVAMKFLWTVSYWDNFGMVVFWRTLLAVSLCAVVGFAIALPPLDRVGLFAPLFYLGRISYGVYLWHLFAIEYAKTITGIKPSQALVVVLALTLIMAATSWTYFEERFVRWSRQGSGK